MDGRLREARNPTASFSSASLQLRSRIAGITTRGTATASSTEAISASRVQRIERRASFSIAAKSDTSRRLQSCPTTKRGHCRKPGQPPYPECIWIGPRLASAVGLQESAMPPEFISVPSRGPSSMRLFFSSLLIVMALVARAASAADDASIGYAKIKPSLVKIWALDGNGKPIQSGTGFVVASDKGGSLILTSAHTVLKAAKIIINIPGRERDIDAHLKSIGPVDTAMLKIDEPNLTPARFVSRDHTLREGSYVAVAGFLKNDESIEIAGLVPRVIYPGTISSLPNSGRFIDLANLNIEEGLSGSPVFDPRTGEVVGMIDTRDTNRQERGGYAISAPLVLSPFFEDQKVRVAYENSMQAPAPAVPVAAPAAPVTVAAAPLPLPVVQQQPVRTVAQAPTSAFPSSAFVAAEPQPDAEPAEPQPQQSFPQQQIFHQLPLQQSDFTVQNSWMTQRPD